MSGGLYGRGKAPQRACLKFEDWPVQDRQLWLKAITPSDPFGEGGGLSDKFCGTHAPTLAQAVAHSQVRNGNGFQRQRLPELYLSATKERRDTKFFALRSVRSFAAKPPSPADSAAR